MHLRSFALAVSLVILAASPSLARDEFDHNHLNFDRILQSHVRDGRVDYEGLKTSSKLLKKYIGSLGSVSEAELNRFTRDQKLAYWLNFYNAALLDAVSANLPAPPADGSPRSPRQIEGLWTVFKWKTPLGLRTLNSMEFDVLRKFRRTLWMLALNRGTVGGGFVSERAYTGTEVARQLETTVKKWLAAPGNFVVDVDGRELRVSEYLNGYFGDFKIEYMDRGGFLGRSDLENVFGNLYLRHGADDAAKAMIRQGEFTLVVTQHDQTLNSLKTP